MGTEVGVVENSVGVVVKGVDKGVLRGLEGEVGLVENSVGAVVKGVGKGGEVRALWVETLGEGNQTGGDKG